MVDVRFTVYMYIVAVFKDVGKLKESIVENCKDFDPNKTVRDAPLTMQICLWNNYLHFVKCR